ncbi:hypothetical protein [Haladaptatus litoreus]|uniref:hypothetical protein n=1 Tax=Haladaptatus litoreus TaxID=553468 RepID=UPI0011156611|nr:hypothetical protein [Haladaptatus litoreus]
MPNHESIPSEGVEIRQHPGCIAVWSFWARKSTPTRPREASRETGGGDQTTVDSGVVSRNASSAGSANPNALTLPC